MRATILTDQPSGREILLVERGRLLCGLSYDPRSASLPVPFASSCSHCVAGTHRDRRWNLHARKQVRAILSQWWRFNGGRYLVPTKPLPIEVRCRTTRSYKYAVATRREPRAVVEVRSPRNEARLEYVVGNRRTIPSPLLRRFLRLVLSERTATPAEIAAASRPLAEQRAAERAGPRRLGGRRLPCKQVDWEEVAR